MKEIVEQGLKSIGDSTIIKELRRVTGGDINDAYYIKTVKQEYFIKINRKAPADFFTIEVEGLKIINDTNAICVPEVLYCNHSSTTNVSILIMEWIDCVTSKKTEEDLGYQLAKLHLSKKDHFGYDKDTYIGYLKQKNELYSNWVEYYRDCRLAWQIEIAQHKGRLNKERIRKFNRLLQTLDKWIPDIPSSGILHGDLWSGNWMAGPNGEPVLIDPSILYGHNEFDIAFTELFGGFSQEFYRSYQAILPLTTEYNDRKQLYQLYYLLVHLNMFGESYGGSIDRILDRYVG